MGKVKIFIYCAVFFLFFIRLGFSETILLKSGQKVEGRIVEKTDKYVKLDFQGVDLVYYNDEIDSVTQEVSNNGNAVSPQLDSLYQAYTSSLNVPQKQKEEKVARVSVPVVSQAAETSPKTPATAPSADLSQLPPGYQKMMQGITQQVTPGAQGGQQGGGNPAVSVPPSVDISQLPSDIQEMIKSSMANLQTAKSGSSDKK